VELQRPGILNRCPRSQPSHGRFQQQQQRSELTYCLRLQRWPSHWSSDSRTRFRNAWAHGHLPFHQYPAYHLHGSMCPKPKSLVSDCVPHAGRNASFYRNYSRRCDSVRFVCPGRERKSHGVMDVWPFAGTCNWASYRWLLDATSRMALGVLGCCDRGECLILASLSFNC
jgi:hypothetical protein